MVKILKTYTPMIFSLMFFTIYASLVNITINETTDSSTLNSYFIAGCIIIVLCLTEWIYFIIKAAKNKETENKAIWTILIYFFNFFLIPYYNFKYIVKVEKIKLNMAIYIILAIVSLIIGYFIPSIIVSNTEPNKLYIQSSDNQIQFEFSGNYQEREVGDYDLYVSDYTKDINVGIFIFTSEDFTTATEIMAYRDEWIHNARENVKIIDSYIEELEDKTITSKIYYGELEGEAYIYQISTIEFVAINHIVNTIEIIFNEDYDKNKEELKAILRNVKVLGI